eukprot:9570539-Prorocentrum_lima.AAC.1
MDPDELGDDVMVGAQTSWVALLLNSALACLKLTAWMTACERVDMVLQIDNANCKALYRRGVALSNID